LARPERSGTAEPMARVVIHAAVQETTQDVRLFDSVSGAEDGLPRSGLASTNVDVMSVASGEDTAPRQQLIAQAVEGPAGIYQLVLEGDGQPSTLVPRTRAEGSTVPITMALVDLRRNDRRPVCGPAEAVYRTKAHRDPDEDRGEDHLQPKGLRQRGRWLSQPHH
jgi:hypothetical protein